MSTRESGLPEPRGPRVSGPREYAGVVFVMGAMVALGVGLAESSALAGLVALAACVPLAGVVYLISSRAFRER
ncbi:MAG TPA: hypothetical protein VFX70_06690 [Mycobacteriales bacterium]|nr:hypothetical protein [Mycobacteriales bacterium]